MRKPLDTIFPTKTGRLKFLSWLKPLLGGGENEELQALSQMEERIRRLEEKVDALTKAFDSFKQDTYLTCRKTMGMADDARDMCGDIKKEIGKLASEIKRLEAKLQEQMA